jgi:transposase-like protein
MKAVLTENQMERSMTPQEKQALAKKHGVHIHTIRRWCRDHGDEKARTMTPMSRSARGKRSKAKGHWTGFMLPGSPSR